MIVTEEKLIDALSRCATHDKDKCKGCFYETWCDADPVNPYMNMPHDALELITSLRNLLWVYTQSQRKLHKDLTKAQHDRERYGRRIRAQREEILDLRAMLDEHDAGTPPDTCASCGAIIPENGHYCPMCDSKAKEALENA